ncbi:nucleoside triphosphate pyrophosphohydrolase [Paraglaciecola psychrophila]|uniref:Nucleoside triphosphate pyrophosphohydrolase n=1 Tax=Paraglaciecola psychrophila 170 TaxID=1129794 RepID=K6Z1T4_9ALTE|nr:nucleoside triphosphate pyrophosphohydrolase [Paraglaciecola psychrophila]AGH42972.1 MazG family protein [Paraglaciecola psychrophila 170]GAC39009.1 nucleoside triphosphate pyrophosphohydrolase [Paraglaciecola psychrophila 170]
MSNINKNNPQLNRLLDIMQQLRDPNTGCPWDQKQNFESIVAYTIEETYEVADAIFSGNMVDIKDELGDLLFQIVFYAQLAEEQKNFDFEDIAQSISDKLVRRHPHVFQATELKTDDELNLQWEKIKLQEREVAARPNDKSVLANIPIGMTPLLRAQKIQRQCSKVGFDWTEIPPVVDKIHEEIEEVLAEVNASEPNQQAVEEEIGDLLFAVVNLARHTSVNAETALIKANRKFEKRFRQVEQVIEKQGLSMESADMQQMEAAWQLIKSR